MTKDDILKAIKQTAASNGGVPLGIGKFEEATGIRKDEWHGKYWTKWNEAITEAGLQPNQFLTPAYDEEWLIEKLVSYIRELDHFPTKAELKIRNYKDRDFPSLTTFNNRLGRKSEMAQKVLIFCEKNPIDFPMY